MFQTSGRTLLQCENCNKTGHTKAKCWAKGGGQEGQYPDWFKGRKGPNHNTVKTITDAPIVWTYGSNKNLEVWIADSAATVHVSPNWEDFDSYHKYDKNWAIKAFGNNTVEGIGEGDIIADIDYQGKCTRVHLTQVMHVPGADGKILSLKVLDQKGFESRIIGGHIQIMKNGQILTEASSEGGLYGVNLKIIPSQESILSAVKRDSSATDIATWH